MSRAETMERQRQLCQSADLLWKDFFKDPYLWYDNRSSKVKWKRQCTCSQFLFLEYERGIGTDLLICFLLLFLLLGYSLPPDLQIFDIELPTHLCGLMGGTLPHWSLQSSLAEEVWKPPETRMSLHLLNYSSPAPGRRIF